MKAQGSAAFPFDPLHPLKIFEPDIAGIATSVKVGNDRVYVGSAYTGEGFNTGYAIFRLKDDCCFDSNFGKHGKTTGTFLPGYISTGYHLIHRIHNGQDQFMVLGMTYTTIFEQMPALARFNADGSLDETFQTGGHLAIKRPIITDDNKPLKSPFRPAFARFSEKKRQITALTANWQMKPVENGFIVFGNYYGHDLVVMMFDWDGNLVKSFNGHGFKYLERPDGNAGVVYGHSVAMDETSILISASRQTADLKFTGAFVTRLTFDGRHLPGFGKQGFADFPDLQLIRHIALIAGERIIGCGQNAERAGLLSAVHYENGDPDNNFKRKPVMPENGSEVRWDRIVMLSSGELVTVGQNTVTTSNMPTILARFSANGTPDLSSLHTLNARMITMPTGCEITEEGHFLLHGQTQLPGAFTGFTARLSNSKLRHAR